MRKYKTVKKIGLTLTCLISASLVFAKPVVRDSIGVENQDGKKVILHQLEQKESYYSLGRKYNLSPQQIITFNANKALKAGDVIRIPTGKPFDSSSSENMGASNTASNGVSEYTVGSKETLFAIAKRFGITVSQLKTANNLKSDALKAGQTLKIPSASATVATTGGTTTNTKTRVISDAELNGGESESPTTSQTTAPTAHESTAMSEPASSTTTQKQTPTKVTEEKKEDSAETKSDVPANRYGIKQIAQSGIGVWVDDLSGESGKMLALHNTAPVGTVIKLTNPMTNRTTYAKVVGKFTESEQNRGAIVVVSKPVASLIGVIDRKFQVNISY